MKTVTDSLRLEIKIWHLAEQGDAFADNFLSVTSAERLNVRKQFVEWRNGIQAGKHTNCLREAVTLRFLRTTAGLE